MVPRDEQVYGHGWTVADLADPAGYDFADRLASAKWVSPQWGVRVHRALARGNARKGGQEMHSFYDESHAGSARPNS
jgi:hypothetical protein